MPGYIDHENTSIDLRSIVDRVWDKRLRIAVVTVGLCVATYFLLSLVPKTYESSASILVEQRDNVFTRATNDTGANNTVVDSVVMSSQVELIQSSETLLQVVRSLNLGQVPEFNGTSTSPLDPIMALIGRSTQKEQGAERKVLALVSKAVTVIQERDSRIISILVRSQDRDLAAKIANEIAETHINRRTQVSTDDTADASRWLEGEIEKLRIRVVDAESKVAAFRIENDLFVGTNNTSLLDQQLSNISGQITNAQERKNFARSRVTLIRNLLSAGQPISGVAEVQNSVIIQRLSQDKARLQGERAQLSATLLPNHPQVRSISAQISEIDQQIRIEGRRVADAMMAEAGIEDAQVASLQDNLARLKISASSAATSTVELQELEREAKAQSDLLQTYLLRFREASARSESGANLPDVRVVTTALPGLVAVAPKSTMILIAVGIVVLAVQIGGILFSELASVVPGLSSHIAHPKSREDEAGDEIDERINEPHLRYRDTAPKGKNAVVQSQDERRSADEYQYDDFLPEETLSEENASNEFAPNEFVPNEFVPNEFVSVGEDAQPVSQNNSRQTSARESAAMAHTQVDERTVHDQGMSQNASQQFSARDAQEVFEQDFYELALALRSGKENLVFLTSYDRDADCIGVSEMLLSDILDSGRSVAVVDAGSGVISAQRGISDLAAGEVEFGQIVFPVNGEGITEVYWGTRPTIYQQSEKPAVLVEALCDICDIVLVFAGGMGVASNLPLFAGLNGTMALVAGNQPAPHSIYRALDDAASLGFERSVLLVMTEQRANVA